MYNAEAKGSGRHASKQSKQGGAGRIPTKGGPEEEGRKVTHIDDAHRRTNDNIRHVEK